MSFIGQALGDADPNNFENNINAVARRLARQNLQGRDVEVVAPILILQQNMDHLRQLHELAKNKASLNDQREAVDMEREQELNRRTRAAEQREEHLRNVESELDQRWDELRATGRRQTEEQGHLNELEDALHHEQGELAKGQTVLQERERAYQTRREEQSLELKNKLLDAAHSLETLRRAEKQLAARTNEVVQREKAIAVEKKSAQSFFREFLVLTTDSTVEAAKAIWDSWNEESPEIRMQQLADLRAENNQLQASVAEKNAMLERLTEQFVRRVMPDAMPEQGQEARASQNKRHRPGAQNSPALVTPQNSSMASSSAIATRPNAVLEEQTPLRQRTPGFEQPGEDTELPEPITHPVARASRSTGPMKTAKPVKRRAPLLHGFKNTTRPPRQPAQLAELENETTAVLTLLDAYDENTENKRSPATALHPAVLAAIQPHLDHFRTEEGFRTLKKDTRAFDKCAVAKLYKNDTNDNVYRQNLEACPYCRMFKQVCIMCKEGSVHENKPCIVPRPEQDRQGLSRNDPLYWVEL